MAPPGRATLRPSVRMASLALFVLVRGSHASDASRPHPHTGILAKYERQPPSKYGLTLEGITQEQLRSGAPVQKLIPIKGGFKRACSIQEICASEELVWSKIMDLNKYSSMVEGVAECEVYSDESNKKGNREVCARYKVGAGPFNMEYFMRHTYEPSKHSMTFALDYARESDFSDTVGYWCARQPAPAPAPRLRAPPRAARAARAGTSSLSTTVGAVCTTRPTRSCPAGSPRGRRAS